MTDARNNAKRNQLGPTIPRGFVLGEFTNYSDATAMVEKLLAGEFKADQVSLIGHSPVLVERIKARLGYGRVALSGFLSTQMPVASRWEVVVPESEAANAKKLLGSASDA